MFETFLLQLAWATIFQMTAAAIFTKSQSPEDAKAAKLEDFDAPTISEGTSVPVIIGSVLTEKQNVSWFGGLRTEEIKQQGVVTGHRYFINAQLSLCHGPIDAVREIRLEDTVIPWSAITTTRSTDYWDMVISARTLLGGDDQEGGAEGRMRLYLGTTGQPPDSEMGTLVGAALPGYRGICYAVARDIYLGTSPRLKPFSFLVEHNPNNLGVPSGKHIIGPHRDSNAVCALYALLTLPGLWSANLPESVFDISAWHAAAVTAYDEGMGISMSFSTSAVEDVIQQVCSYLDAVVYEDPATGLITIKLVREADLASAPTFGTSEIRSVKTRRTGWSELKNTVKVTFTDAARNYETGGVMAQNSAVTAMAGGVQELETVALPGITQRATAMQVAERRLRAASFPLSKVEISGNRKLAALRPGQAVRLQWQRPDIDAYFRVSSVSTATLAEGGVLVTAVEDVFAAGAGTFTVPPDSSWDAGTAQEAQPITLLTLLETPYRLRRSDTRSLIVGAAAPSGQHTGWRAVINGDSGDTSTYGWMAFAPLPAALPLWGGATIASLTLAVTVPAGIGSPTAAQYDAGEALLLVGTELMAYRTLTKNADGSTTFGSITRAVLDTVPRAHPAGSRVIVLASCALRANLDLAADATVQVGARSMTSSDIQDAIDATTSSITTASRALRPYPPAGLSVNGVLYGAGPHTFPATVSWTERNRTDTLVRSQTDPAVPPESATQYHVDVYSADGVTLLESHQTSALSREIGASGSVVIQVRSRRGMDTYSFLAQAVPCQITPPPAGLLTEANGKITTEAGDRIILG